jgi:hypothetical protein
MKADFPNIAARVLEASICAVVLPDTSNTATSTAAAFAANEQRNSNCNRFNFSYRA